MISNDNDTDVFSTENWYLIHQEIILILIVDSVLVSLQPLVVKILSHIA
jgi:hypothetical protein